MLLIFTRPECSACDAKKQECAAAGLPYREIHAERLGHLGITEIDVEAMATYALQGCLPVVIETDHPDLERLLDNMDD